MKITSCDCFKNEENVTEYADIIFYDDRIDIEVKPLDEYGNIELINNIKYCPFCGKKIEVEND